MFGSSGFITLELTPSPIQNSNVATELDEFFGLYQITESDQDTLHDIVTQAEDDQILMAGLQDLFHHYSVAEEDQEMLRGLLMKEGSFFVQEVSYT